VVIETQSIGSLGTSPWRRSGEYFAEIAELLRVAEAVFKVYDARQRYETAKRRVRKNTAELYGALVEARAFEHTALMALHEHIEKHGCSARV
jgi:hypothetical protein